MTETADQIAVRLRYRGHLRADIQDDDRTPETLILAHLSDGPAHMTDLRRLPWFAKRDRRFRCALDRLAFAGEIEACSDGWKIASDAPPVVVSAPAETPRSPASGRKQLSLF